MQVLPIVRILASWRNGTTGRTAVSAKQPYQLIADLKLLLRQCYSYLVCGLLIDPDIIDFQNLRKRRVR